VSVIDIDGIEHTACAGADTLFEAVARGLRPNRESFWGGGIPEGITTVLVCSIPPQAEDRVKVSEFKSWLNRNGGSPTETVHRQKVRAIWAR
jgi:hypothetical protein